MGSKVRIPGKGNAGRNGGMPGDLYIQIEVAPHSFFRREGANIQIFQGGQLFMKTEGPYDGPAVFQEIWPLPRFDGKHFACVGSWIVNGWACGLGIREDDTMITQNTSRFIPHLMSD